MRSDASFEKKNIHYFLCQIEGNMTLLFEFEMRWRVPLLTGHQSMLARRAFMTPEHRVEVVK